MNWLDARPRVEDRVKVRRGVASMEGIRNED
jgi:hypothetical protein